MSMGRLVVRLLLGAGWLFVGLNGLLHFFAPPPLTGEPATYMAGLLAARYVFPTISVVELAAGVMLLTNRFVPLSLVLLAPILVNILGYHLMLDLKGIGAGALLAVLGLFLAWSYRSAYAGLLTAAPPDAASRESKSASPAPVH